MKKFRYFWIIGIIFADQILKAYIRSTMYIGESIPVIKDIFHITYVQNRGGAFSIFSGHGMILVVIPLAAIIAANILAAQPIQLIPMYEPIPYRRDILLD